VKDYYNQMQKTDVHGIFKERDGVLINKDDEGLIAYKRRKQQLKKMDFLETEINTLKTDIAEMKEMMKEMIKGFIK
jgi:hypothetical protein